MGTWRWWVPGGVLGFGLGGFFDGILLHQILQWHHLLSLVPGGGDLRWQVLWDGVFHALMFVVAAAGLTGLWRAHRRGDAVRGSGLFGAVLVGFGLWHAVDAVLSHWLLGIHRIRIDSPNPLAWDLGWLVVFGLGPIAAGWWITRGAPPPRRGTALPLVVLTAVAVVAGGFALRRPPGQPFTTVVFRPGVTPAAVYSALGDLDGRLVWADGAMGVVVVDVAADRRWALYGRGALLVSGSGLAGCLDWSRA